jgi:two-component system sensor histidine kinase CiaH
MRLALPERLRHPRRRADASAADGAPLSAEDTRLLRRTRLRLMAVSGGVTLAVLAVLGFVIYSAVANLVVSDSTNSLREFADSWIGPISGQPPSFPSQPIDQEYGTRRAGLFIVIVDDQGTVLLRTRSLPPGMPVEAGLEAVAGGGTDMRDVVTGNGVPLRVYTASVTDTQGRKLTVQTAYDRSQEVKLLNLLLLVMIVGGAAAILAALVAGYLYSGRALVPIRESIERRQAALKRQREFAANASHELRTPLTVIRASVEDLRRNPRKRVIEVGSALEDIEAEIGTVTALVDDMLLLARTDSGRVQLDCVPLDLSDVATEAVSLLGSLGAERGVTVTLEPLPAPIEGDPVRLRQLVTILVDNAIRHSPRGSYVEVRIRPLEEAGGAALLEVMDAGPGIKAEDMPRLWERFWRADNAPEGGTGLGLAIARWITEQHGGQIGAENRPEGGARFWVRLGAPGSKPGGPGFQAASPRR